MKVKIKCKKCGQVRIRTCAVIKDARKIKKRNKKYICGKCEFGIMANKVAKEIVRSAKRIC